MALLPSVLDESIGFGSNNPFCAYRSRFFASNPSYISFPNLVPTMPYFSDRIAVISKPRQALAHLSFTQSAAVTVPAAMGGRNVAKTAVALVVLAVASVLFSVQAMGQASGDPPPGLKASFLGGAVTCSQPEKRTEKFVVPLSLARRARLKARLMNLLHESLSDDSKGIVNI